jgi:hypothetical protein
MTHFFLEAAPHGRYRGVQFLEKIGHITHFLEVSAFYPEKYGISQNPLSDSPEPRKCLLLIIYQWVNAIKQRNHPPPANAKTAQNQSK